MYLSKSEIKYFNIDYIEVYGSLSNCNLLFEWVDGDNSNMIQFGEFNLEKTTGLKNYDFKISFKINNLTVFAYYGWKKLNENVTTRDYFTVYGSAFSQFDTDEILEFINMYIVPDSVNEKKWINELTIKRFDLALDIKREIQKWVLDHFKNRTQKWANFYWSKWDVETHYIWAYSVRENKSSLIRIYNKKADILKKWTQYLYPDYLLEKHVTRIEIEFRVELTKLVKIDSLSDPMYLFNLMLKYFKKHTNIFETLKTNKVEKLKRFNKKINIEELKFDQVVRQRYLAAFKWYAKTILKIWACPVDILLRNQLISEITQNDIPYCIVKTDIKKIVDPMANVRWDFDLSVYSEWKTTRNTLHRQNKYWQNRSWK